MKLKSTYLSVFLLIFSFSSNSFGRDYIEIVGSSTVYPFSIAVAERFGKSTKFKTPK